MKRKNCRTLTANPQRRVKGAPRGAVPYLSGRSRIRRSVASFCARRRGLLHGGEHPRPRALRHVVDRQRRHVRVDLCGRLTDVPARRQPRFEHRGGQRRARRGLHGRARSPWMHRDVPDLRDEQRLRRYLQPAHRSPRGRGRSAASIPRRRPRRQRPLRADGLRCDRHPKPGLHHRRLRSDLAGAHPSVGDSGEPPLQAVALLWPIQAARLGLVDMARHAEQPDHAL